jgi:hypothetical protein
LSEFFGDPGWDGNLDETDVAATPEPEAVVEEAPVVEAEAAPQEPVAEESEPEAEERERDAQGRFLPKKLEVDDPDVAALLDKYQGDPVKALKAAAEAQRTIGGMANELGQLRQHVEALAQRPEPTPVTPPTQITQDMIEQNPGAATQLAYEQGNLAYEQGNQVALQIAFEQWKLDEPADAVAWVMTQQMNARDQAWAQKLEQFEQRIAPVAQSQEQSAFAAALREIQAQDPGVLDRIQANIGDVPEETREALNSVIQNGSPTEQIGAFKALAALTRGRETPATLSVQALAREQALAADEAIAEANVVSANSARSEPVGKTLADAIGDEWDQIESPLASGWNIG